MVSAKSRCHRLLCTYEWVVGQAVEERDFPDDLVDRVLDWGSTAVGHGVEVEG